MIFLDFWCHRTRGFVWGTAKFPIIVINFLKFLLRPRFGLVVAWDFLLLASGRCVIGRTQSKILQQAKEYVFKLGSLIQRQGVNLINIYVRRCWCLMSYDSYLPAPRPFLLKFFFLLVSTLLWDCSHCWDCWNGTWCLHFDSALLISSRAGADLGQTSDKLRSFVNWVSQFSKAREGSAVLWHPLR